MRRLFAGFLVLAICTLAYADVIHFIDGTKLKGKIVHETKDMVVIDTGKERIPVQKSVIKRIERDSPPPQPDPKPTPAPAPKPKPVEEEQQELTEEQQEQADAIKKTLKKWMNDRKKIRCKTCKGAGKVICPACKGTGKDVLREPFTGRPIRIETCKYCDGNKTVICKKCGNGLNKKYAEKVFWEILSPKRKKALEKEFGSKEKFLEWLYRAYHGDLEKHADLAGKLQFIDHNKYVSYEVTRYDFNGEMTQATVSVRLKANLNQKVEERKVERLCWVQDGDKWYLDPIGD